MRVELTSLNKEPSTRSTQILTEAAAKLGLKEYERFKRAFQRGLADYELLDVLDSESDEVIGEKFAQGAPPMPLQGNSCLDPMIVVNVKKGWPI